MRRPIILASICVTALSTALAAQPVRAQAPMAGDRAAYPPAGMVQPAPQAPAGGMGEYPAPPMAQPAPPPSAGTGGYTRPGYSPAPAAQAPMAEYPPAMGMTPAPGQAAPAQGVGNPDEAFAGLSQQEFYDLDGRIARIEQRAQALPSGQRRKAMAQLRSIRGEAAFRRKRKGELKDWDLEFLHGRLNALVRRYPSLGQ